MGYKESRTNRKSEEKGEKIRRTRKQKKQNKGTKKADKGTKWNIKSEHGSIQAEKRNRKEREQMSKIGKKE